MSNTCSDINLNSGQPAPAEKPGGNGGGRGAIVISASVGINSTNLVNDVTVIQDALNRVSPAGGGPSPLLVVDGICGSKTKNAIQQFQLKQFGWSGADGKINPGGQTITRLNELVGGGSADRPMDSSGGYPAVDDKNADELFKVAMTSGLNRAKKWIRAAQANLDIALTYVDQPNTPGVFQVFGREERMRLANRYFKIDDFPTNQRRLTLQRVRHVYATMLQVFERPGGLWGEKAFEIDSTGIVLKQSKTATAHTNLGGFFKGGKESPFQKGQRADSIFFVRQNIAYFYDQDKGTKTIVHELAHFCGDYRMGWDIEDFGAYGEPEEARVKRLSPWERVHHADSYARFARAAGS
jgi:hypothetical protein